MRLTRTYNMQPDRANCYQPGCTFHREGPTAEPLGEAHASATGHEVRVTTGATLVFRKEHYMAVTP